MAGVLVNRHGRVGGVVLGPIGVLFLIAWWLIAVVFIGLIAALVLLALTGSILAALVVLASDRLLVAMSPSWRARRAARGPIRRPLLLVAAVVGSIGPPSGQRRRTLTTGTSVAAAIGKLVPKTPD